MAGISAAGEHFRTPDPGRPAGLSAIRTLAIALATIVLSVIATSAAVGGFLRLAIEARMESVEDRLKAVEEGMRRIGNILLYRQGAAPTAPGAGEP